MVKLDAGSAIQPYGDVLVIPMKMVPGVALCDFLFQKLKQDELSLDDIIYLQDVVSEKGFGALHNKNIVQ